jgi:hypothetical protein
VPLLVGYACCPLGFLAMLLLWKEHIPYGGSYRLGARVDRVESHRVKPTMRFTHFDQ